MKHSVQPFIQSALLFVAVMFILTLMWSSCGQKSNPFNSANSTINQPTRLAGSPYPASHKPDTLFWVDESSMSATQVLTIESLQGILAQTKPRIYVTNGSDSYLTWLTDMQKNYEVIVDNSFRADFSGLLNHFKSFIAGYILTTTTQPSIHIAVSLAGLKSAIVVVGVDEQTVKGLGFPLLEDATNETYQQFIDNHKDEVNKNTLCYQDPSKAEYLLDYSVFGKTYFFYDDISGSIYSEIFSEMNPNSALLGWGSSEYDLVETASRKSIMVHAADFASDLLALSNFGVETNQASHNTTPQVIQNVHTVCFVMTDGDNIQWLLNDFSTNTNWYASPDRGKVNLGWTISPAMCELAPTVLKRFYDSEGKAEGGRDCFIAGPSGVGYTYPESYEDIGSYTSLTAAFMKKADLHIVNIIGNSNPPNVPVSSLASYMSQNQIDAAFYYFYSNYSGGNGQITWVDGKPVITGRYNLWSPQFETPQSLAAKLNALATDITSSNGYSLIPVHVWSHTVDDVIQCASLFNKSVRVVAPDEFVALIEKNVKH